MKPSADANARPILIKKRNGRIREMCVLLFLHSLTVKKIMVTIHICFFGLECRDNTQKQEAEGVRVFRLGGVRVPAEDPMTTGRHGGN